MNDENKTKKVGKGAEPKSEELEFIYNQMEQGLSDAEIIDEMQDKPFILRTKGFFVRRRREFTAAKKVLQEVARKEIDPLTIKRKEQHYDDLLKVVSQIISLWEDLGQGVSEYDKSGKPIVGELQFEQINRHHAEYLLTHLKAEFPEYCNLKNWESLIDYEEAPSLILQKLYILKNRRTFEGTCNICKDWCSIKVNKDNKL